MSKQSPPTKAVIEKKLEVFTEVMARTGKPSQAIAEAFPDVYARDKHYAAVKANRLLKKPDIQSKIDDKLQKMAPSSLKRIKKLINSADEGIATQNAWRVVEHIRGRPTQRTQNINMHMNIEDVL